MFLLHKRNTTEYTKIMKFTRLVYLFYYIHVAAERRIFLPLVCRGIIANSIFKMYDCSRVYAHQKVTCTMHVYL